MCDSCPGSGTSTMPSGRPASGPGRDRRGPRFRAQRRGEPPRLQPGQGLGEALQRPQRRLDEELAPHERRHRVTRQPEDERLAANTERHGLPGPDRDAPEDLLDAKLRLDAPHEIVRSDRHAAGGDENVRCQPALERRPVRRLVVGDGRQHLDVDPDGGERCREHDPVRLVDLARRQRRPGRRKLRSRRNNHDARVAGRTGSPPRRQRRARRRVQLRDEHPPARQPRPQRRRRRADERSRPAPGALRTSTLSQGPLSSPTTYSTGTTASAPSGTTPPVEISIASPSARARVAGCPAATRATTGNRPGRSVERSAYPSMADEGNGGRSTSARTGSAVIRPMARASPTASAGSVRARARIRAWASSRASGSSTTAIRYPGTARRSRRYGVVVVVSTVAGRAVGGAVVVVVSTVAGRAVGGAVVVVVSTVAGGAVVVAGGGTSVVTS